MLVSIQLIAAETLTEALKQAALRFTNMICGQPRLQRDPLQPQTSAKF